ncbi:hypothetical protein MMC13_003512 [Lambiella insularis]|nr:hypothetical protein [Lambiella insularis]
MAIVTTHDYAADILKTPGFFTAAISSDGENPFEQSFTNQVSSRPTTKYTFDENQESFRNSMNIDNNLFLQNVPDNHYTPLFGYSKMSEYPNPIFHQQIPSPPSSAKHTPLNWPYSEFQPQPQPPRSALHSLVTGNNPNNPRIEYGQVTPPDDQTPNLDYHSLQSVYPEKQMNESQSGRKRKRMSATNADSTGKPTKHSKRSAARSKVSSQASSCELQSPEDEKRSKFLERNRVAASKCRQKKKEWTSNLEARARELQNSKNRLAIMVTSLKDEVLWLKGEMLKHTECGCAQIRDYLAQQADSITNPSSSHKLFESAASPVRSAPTSRTDSASSESQSPPLSQASFGFDEGEETRGQRSPSAHFKTENELEALLTSQLAQDTSDTGIAHRIGRT